MNFSHIVYKIFRDALKIIDIWSTLATSDKLKSNNILHTHLQTYHKALGPLISFNFESCLLFSFFALRIFFFVDIFRTHIMRYASPFDDILREFSPLSRLNKSIFNYLSFMRVCDSVFFRFISSLVKPLIVIRMSFQCERIISLIFMEVSIDVVRLIYFLNILYFLWW